MDGRLQALGHETPPHATDGREADIQGRDDLLIGAAGPGWPFVAEEQDPGMTSFRAAALPEDTMRSSACRSSTVRVTLYFSTGVLLPLAQSRLNGSTLPINELSRCIIAQPEDRPIKDGSLGN